MLFALIYLQSCVVFQTYDNILGAESRSLFDLIIRQNAIRNVAHHASKKKNIRNENEFSAAIVLNDIFTLLSFLAAALDLVKKARLAEKQGRAAALEKFRMKIRRLSNVF